jgi:ankyrin repeat protein
MSLLMLACKKTKINTVQTLLRQSDLQVYHRDQTGKNAAHYAIENQD